MLFISYIRYSIFKGGAQKWKKAREKGAAKRSLVFSSIIFRRLKFVVWAVFPLFQPMQFNY